MKKWRGFIGLVLALVLLAAACTALASETQPKLLVRDKATGVDGTPEVIALTTRGADQTAVLRVNNVHAKWSIVAGGARVELTPDGSRCTVKGIEGGYAIVQAQLPDGSTVKANIVVKEVRVRSVSMAKKLILDPKVGTYQLTARVLPASASNTGILWSCSDIEGEYVSLTNEGLLIIKNPALVPQNTIIKVTATAVENHRKATCTIVLKDVLVSKLRLNKKSVTLKNLYDDPGTVQLKATATPALATVGDPSLTWSSDDPAIAKVDANGLVTAVGEGKTRIYASADDQAGKVRAYCVVTVKAVRAKSITLNEKSTYLDHTLSSESTVVLDPTISPATATFQQIAWTSSDESIAEVDENGKVTGKSAGLVTIAASTDKGRKTASCTVRVRDKSAMKHVTITGIGDFMIGGDVKKGTYARFKNILTGKILGDGTVHAPDYSYPTKKCKWLFEQDDITIANLEVALTSRTSPRNPDNKFNIKGDPDNAQILALGSIEVANLANNQNGSYGTKGVNDTKRALMQYGVAYTTQGKLLTLERNGLKVGIVNMRTPVSKNYIRSRVKIARESCDVVVVSFHFCDMTIMTSRFTSRQVNAAHAAIDAGADLVMGHHTHLISGMEKYKGKYIAYGLGSFIGTNDVGMLLTFALQERLFVGTDPNTGETFVEAETPTVYPACISGVDPNAQKVNNCQPIFLDKATDSTRYNEVVNKIKKFSKYGSLTPADFNLGNAR